MGNSLFNDPGENTDWRHRLHVIIFGADTPAGKRFDVVLLWLIVISVIIVMLESVREFNDNYGTILYTLEWIFTIIFTIEYIARIVSVKKPLNYIFSFFGIIDLLSILPTYLGFFLTGAHSLRIVRILRFMRIFRVLKLIGFMKEARQLTSAMRASRHKIIVFMTGVLMAVTLLGTIMYIVEGQESGFTSIPRSIYWAIVTLTTVGYGDIAPATAIGQTIASIVMLIGYAVIAVPTGIVTAELTKRPTTTETSAKSCVNCGKEGHADDAEYCRYCGHKF